MTDFSDKKAINKQKNMRNKKKYRYNTYIRAINEKLIISQNQRQNQTDEKYFFEQYSNRIFVVECGGEY